MEKITENMGIELTDRIVEQVPSNRFPHHVLIIPDGNGRWAGRQNMHPSFGHIKGAEVLSEVLAYMQKLPIKFVTVWGFACDNWKRSEEEINALMQIFEKQIQIMVPRLMDDSVKFIHLGRKDRIPNQLRETIDRAEELTRTNAKQVFSLAIDFGGEDQTLRIVRTARNTPKDIDITSTEKLRDGSGEVPPADLIIRTSGEQRTSDIGWLGINAEFYTITKLLPDASIEDFAQALLAFSKRERRFGERLQIGGVNRMI